MQLPAASAHGPYGVTPPKPSTHDPFRSSSGNKVECTCHYCRPLQNAGKGVGLHYTDLRENSAGAPTNTTQLMTNQRRNHPIYPVKKLSLTSNWRSWANQSKWMPGNRVWSQMRGQSHSRFMRPDNTHSVSAPVRLPADPSPPCHRVNMQRTFSVERPFFVSTCNRRLDRVCEQ